MQTHKTQVSVRSDWRKNQIISITRTLQFNFQFIIEEIKKENK